MPPRFRTRRPARARGPTGRGRSGEPASQRTSGFPGGGDLPCRLRVRGCPGDRALSHQMAGVGSHRQGKRGWAEAQSACGRRDQRYRGLALRQGSRGKGRGGERECRPDSELEGLRGRVVQLEEADQENRRLKELLDFREAAIFPAGSEFVVARVIGRSPTRWQEWVHIDKGSADGLKLNQPVVGATNATGDSLSGKGLVGKVVGVSENVAQIQNSKACAGAWSNWKRPIRRTGVSKNFWISGRRRSSLPAPSSWLPG